MKIFGWGVGVISPSVSSLIEQPEPCRVGTIAVPPCTTHGTAFCVDKARLSAVCAVGSDALAGAPGSGKAKSGVKGDEARRLVSLWKSAA